MEMNLLEFLDFLLVKTIFEEYKKLIEKK